MRGFRVSSVLAATSLGLAALATPSRAQADVTLIEKDGWTFYTNGLVAAHYQLVKGDADPSFSNGVMTGKPSAGGQILDERVSSDQRDKTLTMSNLRSGFIGTQLGLGLNRQINEQVKVESLLAINVAGINNNRGTEFQKHADYREAWAQLVTPYGKLKFGRMFGIFGEGSAEVMAMAWKYGVGHPCTVRAATISCGSSGAGPIYAGFDAAIRYISPRLAGFELALAVVDPSVTARAKMSPLPRFDGEVNFDQTFDPVSIRVIAQGMYEKISTSTPPAGTMAGTKTDYTIWGGMGTAILGVGPVKVGGGGWMGTGVGERVPLETSDPANPIFADQSGELRKFRGYYGNIQGELMNNFLTLGGGILYVQPTVLDTGVGTAPSSVLDRQYELHATYQYKYDAIVFSAEFMHWVTKWHFGEQQELNFMGAGINYVW
jgi:predicted porin